MQDGELQYASATVLPDALVTASFSQIPFAVDQNPPDVACLPRKPPTVYSIPPTATVIKIYSMQDIPFHSVGCTVNVQAWIVRYSPP